MKCSNVYRMMKIAVEAADIALSITIILVVMSRPMGYTSLIAFIALLASTMVGVTLVYRDVARMESVARRLEERILESASRISCVRGGESIVWLRGGRLYCYSPPHDRGSAVMVDQVLERRSRGVGGLGFVCAAPLSIEEYERGDGWYRARGVIAFLDVDGSFIKAKGVLHYYFTLDKLIEALD